MAAMLAQARAGRSGGNTFVVNVNGARDPAATAREVEAALKRLATKQAALLSD